MLVKMKKPKRQSSNSKRLERSAAASGAFKIGLPPTREIEQETIAKQVRPQIKAAQQLIARIAARIVTERKADEH
jgi:hypothetical protein